MRINKAGRKPSPNPRTLRVTLLVTPQELSLLETASRNPQFEGNVSLMIRSIVFQAIRPVTVAGVSQTSEIQEIGK